MSEERGRRRDAGSRGLLDVLRHPLTAFTAPFREGAAATDEDRGAASGSEGRVVTCVLRASFETLPQRWKYGSLLLDGSGVRWIPGLRPHGTATALPWPVRVEAVREVQRAERVHVKARFFQVIEVSTDRGPLLLGVPRDSVALVVERLRLPER